MQTTVTAATTRRFSDAGGRQWADLYNGEVRELEHANFRARRDVVVDYVVRTLPAGGRVLDLGCGSAPVLSQLRQRGISCTGLDLTEDMLQHARERLRGMALDEGDLHPGDCRHTPFPDGSFDVVVCLGVISYVEQYGEVLDELHRLVRPGGKVLVSFRNRFNPMLFDPVKSAKTLVKWLLRRGPERYVIGRYMDPVEVRRELCNRGFVVLERHGIGYGPLRFGGRPILSEARSIRLSAALTRAFDRMGATLPSRWLADVTIFTCEKPGATTPRA